MLPHHGMSIRHGSTRFLSSITKFLKKGPIPLIIDSSSPPQLTPELFGSSEFDAYRANFANYNEFYASLESKIPSYTQNVLPTSPTDIKGVDSILYLHLRKPKIVKEIPRTVKNEFFSLTFFPANHHFSLFRKSYIAYTFTNKAGHKLNNKVLEASLDKYKGKYRSLGFFRENLLPLYTAFGRTRFRKFIKGSLYDSIHRVVSLEKELEQVAGIFRFSFVLVPTTSKDRKIIQADMDKAIRTIISDQAYRKKLAIGVSSSNNKGDLNYLMRNITRYNSIGEQNLPGYIPKFPFNKRI